MLSETPLEVLSTDSDHPPPESDRSTKKAKFRNVEQPDSPVGIMSFRDKVLQADKAREDYVAGNLEEFELYDDDVSIVKDGILPAIDFSPRVRDELAKPWRTTVVVKLLGRPIGYKNLCNRLDVLWNFTQGFDIIDLENDFFLVKFRSGGDVEAVITGGPWVILGHYLSVQSWKPSFDCFDANIQSIVAWIRLPGMSIQYYNKKVLRFIGQMVGKVIRIDYCTESAERGKFARIAVEIDLMKPLVSHFSLDGRVQSVEYECLPRICFSCGKFGHTKEHCPETITPVAAKEIISEKTDVPIPDRDPVSSDPVANPKYGPWMIVGRRGKPRFDSNKSNHNNPGKSVSEKESSGSRFQSLENEVIEVIEQLPNKANISVLKDITNLKTVAGHGNSSPRVPIKSHAANVNINPNGSVMASSKQAQVPKPTMPARSENTRFIINKAPTNLDPKHHSVVSVTFNHPSSSSNHNPQTETVELEGMDMESEYLEPAPPDIADLNGNIKPNMKLCDLNGNSSMEASFVDLCPNGNEENMEDVSHV
ncbi:uncharacterized protein LOC126680661 [Mercurialis annua]|uniref:uncharacterized protein LOC126680661 n=1 Tax=Mercurialis annua TaxID=3986 RepID=UPI002160F2F9|nr:uncharacterized protein LOC126680661 [Mercurialis annua]